MDKSKTLLRVILTLVSTVFTVGVVAAGQLNIRSSWDGFLDPLVNSDYVIVGDVVGFSRHTSVGGLWSDEYLVYHLEGYALTANGKELIDGHFEFRTGVADDDLAQSQVDLTTTQQLFVFNKHNPQGSMWRFHNGIAIFGNGTTIVGLVDGHLTFERTFNNPDCAPKHDEYEDVIIEEEDGRIVVITAEEIIAMEGAGSCEDGSVWSKGNDRPVDYVPPQPMTRETFETLLIKYMAEKNSLASVPPTGVHFDRGPSSSWLTINDHDRNNMAMKLDGNEHWLDLIEEAGSLLERESDRAHIAFAVERADYLNVPYSDRLNEFRDEYFADYPRPSHALKRPRPKGQMKRFPELRVDKPNRLDR